MDHLKFETLAQKALDGLPPLFRDRMENVHVVIEDMPTDTEVKRLGIRDKRYLLGLYEGVPKSKRGAWYGMYPVLPDRIILYKTNIERPAKGDLEEKIREVLVHEIAHHFGMTEKEIQDAGY